MNTKIPNSRRNLDIAIDRIFGADNNQLQIRTLIANTIVGQLLPNGVVKGGCSLKLRYGDNVTRFTRDLDMVRADDLRIFIEQLDIALRKGWNGFTGRIVQKEPAQPEGVPGEYVMQPFEIKLEYNGKSWLTVPLEVGHDEIGDTETYDYYISPEIVTKFEQLGFPHPSPIPLLKLEYQIAQKLHALSFIGSERAHDLIDLQVIAQNEKIDYLKAKSACERLFAYRKQPSWPPVISGSDKWNSLYKNQIGKLHVIKDINEAINWANNLVSTINATKVI